MLTKKARLWVIGIAILLLGWTISQQVYEISAVIGIGIALLIWGYFREGTVVMAARDFMLKTTTKLRFCSRRLKTLIVWVNIGEVSMNLFMGIWNFIGIITMKLKSIFKLPVNFRYEIRMIKLLFWYIWQTLTYAKKILNVPQHMLKWQKPIKYR